ncbi:WD40 repeat domain-containing protein [Streptomyces sp. NPDC058985]|uniref:WD40 repeat domain-containing protein n=1 Tax=Streptomyces sp. NPDC058985 TaxID=3346684 RepID=UPI0036D1CBD8
MSVPLGRLVEALETQSGAFTSALHPGSAASLAQQLLYAAHADPSLADFAAPAGERLRTTRDADDSESRPPQLLTRWAAVSTRPAVWMLREEIWAMAPDDAEPLLYTAYGDGKVVALRTDAPLEEPLAVDRMPDRVLALSPSPDGSMLASGDAAGTVRVSVRHDGPHPVWVTHDLSGEARHTEQVNGVVWTGDGRVLTVAGDGRVIVWDPWPGGGSSVLAALEQSTITCVAALGDTVWTGDDRGEIREWSPSTGGGRLLASYGRVTHFTSMAVARDGTYLYLTGFSGTVDRWRLGVDLPVREQVGSVPGKLWSLALSPDGARVFAGDASGLVLGWNTHEPGSAPELAEVRPRAVSALVHPAAASLYCASRDGGVSVSDGSRPLTVPEPGTAPGGIWQLAATPDCSTVLLGGTGGLYRGSLTEEGAVRLDALDPANLRHAVLLDGGEEALVVSGEQIVHWQLADPPRRTVLKDGVVRGKRDVTAMAPVPGARAAVVTRDDEAVEHWEFYGQPGAVSADVRTVGYHMGGRIGAVAVSPRGNWAVTANDTVSVMRWNLARDGGARFIGVHDSKVMALAVTADGGHVATGDKSGRLAVWDAESGVLFTELLPVRPEGRGVRGVTVARDGTWLACFTDSGDVCAWAWPDSPDSVPAVLFPGEQPWRAAAVDGGLLISDRRAGLTLVDVVPPPRPSTAPDVLESDRTLLIVDQWGLREMLKMHRSRVVDFDALSLWLSAGEPCVRLFTCPDLDKLSALRGVAKRSGWAVRDVPVDRPGQLRMLSDLVRAQPPARHVVLLSDAPEFRRLRVERGSVLSVVDRVSEAVLQ